MTDYEKALQEGAQPVESDYDRALRAGAKPVVERPQDFVGRAKFAVQHPVESLKAEAGDVATGLSNALDTATLGLYRKARNAVGERVDPQGTAEMNAREQATNEAHPFVAGLTGGAGYFIPGGAPSMIAESAAAGLGRVAAVAPQAIARVLTSRPVAGAIAGGATGGASQVAQDVSNGATLDAGEGSRAGRAALIGAALGGGAGTVGAAGSRVARAIRNPQTLVGRTLRDVAAGGGRISPVGEPVHGGVYDTPEMQNLPHGKEGYNQLAYEEGQRLTEHNDAKLHGARANYGERINERLAANGDTNHFVVDTHNLLDRLEEENTINGVTGDPHLASAIDKTRRMLTKDVVRQPEADIPIHEMPPEGGHVPTGNGPTDENWLRGARRDFAGEDLPMTGPQRGHATVGGATRPDGHNPLELAATEPQGRVMTHDLTLNLSGNSSRQPTVESWPAVNVPDLIKTKRIVDSLAEHGMPATPENRPYRLIAGSLAKELEGVDPAIAGLNREYAGTMRDLERSNDVVYGSDRAEVPTRAARERRAAGFLGRIGDDTQAVTVAAPQIDELAAMDPEFAKAFQRLRAKKAQERLRYGYPEISTNIEKAGHSFVRQNLDAAKARVALPVAEALGRVGPSPLSLMYLPEAVRKAREARRRTEQR